MLTSFSSPKHPAGCFALTLGSRYSGARSALYPGYSCLGSACFTRERVSVRDELLAGAEGFEPPSPVLETGSLTVELTPLKKLPNCRIL